jgi:hypothetical protein
VSAALTVCNELLVITVVVNLASPRRWKAAICRPDAKAMAVTMTTGGTPDGTKPTITSTAISNVSVATCGARVPGLARALIHHSSATPATNAA